MKKNHHSVEFYRLLPIILTTALLSSFFVTHLSYCADKVKFSGDLGFRHESNAFGDGASPYHLQQIRMRLKADYKFSDDIKFGIRFTTGNPDNPNSSYHELGQAFYSLNISIDRAFMTYRPSYLNGAWLTVGKMKLPFRWNPIYSELVWDADVHPEGALIGFKKHGLKLVIGEFLIKSNHPDEAAYLTTYHASSKIKLGSFFKIGLGLSYYRYDIPDGMLLDNSLYGTDRWRVTNYGKNHVADRDGDGYIDSYAYNFGINNQIYSIEYTGFSNPITISFEYIHNKQEYNYDDTGWAFGFAIGKTKKKGDWRLYIQMQDIGKEAIFSEFAQDDFPMAVNFGGPLFGYKNQISDDMLIHLLLQGVEWAQTDPYGDLWSRYPPSGADVKWRARIETTIKF